MISPSLPEGPITVLDGAFVWVLAWSLCLFAATALFITLKAAAEASLSAAFDEHAGSGNLL